MKREQFITNLIKEGLSEKTLVRFSDNQIKNLHERFFGEQVMTQKPTSGLPHVKTGSPDEVKMKSQGKTFVAYEGEMGEGKKLTDKQKKFLDKNKNNKLDAEDFKMLRKGNKQDTNESLWGITQAVILDKLKKKLGRKPKESEIEKEYRELEKEMKNSMNKEKTKKKSDKKESEMNESKKGGVLGQKDRLVMTLKSLKENEILDLFENLVKEKYHPFTSKSEIINLVNKKLNESTLPDFFTWDAIKSLEGENQMGSLEEKKNTTTKPAPPKEKEKTREKPGKPGWSPNPGPNKKPKMKSLDEKKKNTTTKPATPKTKPDTPGRPVKPDWVPKPGPGKKPKMQK